MEFPLIYLLINTLSNDSLNDAYYGFKRKKITEKTELLFILQFSSFVHVSGFASERKQGLYTTLLLYCMIIYISDDFTE